MRKTMTAGLAVLTFGGALATAALPATAAAQARHGGHYSGRYYGDHRHHNNTGVAIAAGIAGLAIGAALADSGRHRDYGYPAYSYSYGYPSYYAYDYPAYATCESRHWEWDPYLGRRVLIINRYAC